MSPRFRPFALGVALVTAHAIAAEPPARDRAKALLAELDRQGASRGAAKDAVAEARRALERADKARLAGDQKHGTELEALALEWAEAGRDLKRAETAETRAAGLEKKLTEAEATLRTTRTLIEQAAARRARADAELAELRRAKTETPPPAASGSAASAPGAKPNAPSAKPATPGAAPAAPSAKPKASGTAPAASGVAPAKPAPSAAPPGKAKAPQ